MWIVQGQCLLRHHKHIMSEKSHVRFCTRFLRARSDGPWAVPSLHAHCIFPGSALTYAPEKHSEFSLNYPWHNICIDSVRNTKSFPGSVSIQGISRDKNPGEGTLPSVLLLRVHSGMLFQCGETFSGELHHHQQAPFSCDASHLMWTDQALERGWLFS